MSIFMQILIILGATLVLVPLAKRIGLPMVLGYLLTGLLLGSSLFNIAEATLIQQMTNYGMIMLMFLIGLELKPSHLWSHFTSRFSLASILFLACSIVLMLAIFVLFQQSLLSSIVLATALALSSHFLVLQHFSEQQQFNSIQGQQSYSILVFQALIMMPLLIMLPLFPLIQSSSSHGIAYLAACIAAFSGLFLFNRYALQPAIAFIVQQNARELLMPMGLFILLASIAIMDLLGIHSTLAALLAGILMADSICREEIEQHVRPLKGFLIGIFFLAVGMQIQLQLLLEMPTLIVGAAFALVAIKALLVFALCSYFKHNMHHRLLTASCLAQAGEFSFILLFIASEQQLLTPAALQPALFIIAISMCITPVLYHLVKQWILPAIERRHLQQQTELSQPRIVIAGFGRFGQIVARVLHRHELPFSAIDANVDTQYFDAPDGVTVFQADPRQPEILHHAGIQHAELFILAVDDVEDSVMIARYVRLNYPNLNILARARDRYHLHLLRDLGITQIWRENYLTSLGMAYTALCKIGIPSQQAQASVDQFRDNDELLLDQQQRIYTDETKVYQSYPHVMAELALLFECDEQYSAVQQTPHPTQDGQDHDVQADSTQHNRMNIHRK